MASDGKKAPKPPKVFRQKRAGAITKVEQDLVTQFVMDSPREITDKQVQHLSHVLRREKDTVRRMIEAARERFLTTAERYVEIHKRAVEDALAEGSPKGLEQAIKGSQWAMEHLSAEGVSLLEKKAEAGGTKIMVGVRIGGLTEGGDDSGKVSSDS